jgi:crotonobetainyl-CoA:carnitine CoA-transferase CaiB-like acyl-CoA transferase
MPAEPTGSEGQGPLAGLRVLELASLFAAPLIGAVLGDLGADVVKVEPPGGDQLRVLGGDAQRPGPWTLQSRNKRMITLDPSTPPGRVLLHRLTAVADVVTLNHTTTLLEKLECTYEDIAARNPRAIVVNTTAFGPTGPYAGRTGNGSIAEAFAGLTPLLRGADDDLALTPVLFGDYLTALAGVAGTLAACYWRDAQGGRGQYLDLTMYEAVLALLGPQVLAFNGNTGGRPAAGESAPRRTGLRGSFQAGDGRWVVATAYSDAQIHRLLEAVGVAVDPEAGSSGSPDLASLAAEWISTQDRDQVVEALVSARIQVAPVNDLVTLAADPQAQHRASLVSVARTGSDPVNFPRPTPTLSATPASIRWADRPVGADQEAVLHDWLGRSSEAGRMGDPAAGTGPGPLSTKVLDYGNLVKKLVARAKEPGYRREVWAPLTEMIAVDRFERIGIYREKMNWDEYLDFMVPWATSKDFDISVRRITEAGNLVFFEIEEHHVKDGAVTIVNSMNVYEFNDEGKICHLDVYLQGQLGSAAFQAPT